MKQAAFRQLWAALSERPRIQTALKILKRFFVVAIIALLIYQLSEIGWRELIRNLPTTPVFYLLFVAMYVTLPLVELLIYRRFWPISRVECLRAFFKKRVYNEEVVGYSGELYLFLWARRRLSLPDRRILQTIRDNNILSALTSNLFALFLLGVLVYTGQLEILEWLDNLDSVYVATGVVLGIIALALLIQFRRYVFSLRFRQALVVFSIYMGRLLVANALLIVQWQSVLPNISLGVWFTFLALTIVINRIPFLPSKDLVFLGAGIELSRILNVTTAAIAGMLLVSSVLNKVTNLAIFVAMNYVSKDPDLERARDGKPLEELESERSEVVES